MKEHDPNDGDRKTPEAILDQETILAMFREADGGCWDGEESSDD